MAKWPSTPSGLPPDTRAEVTEDGKTGSKTHRDHAVRRRDDKGTSAEGKREGGGDRCELEHFWWVLRAKREDF